MKGETPRNYSASREHKTSHMKTNDDILGEVHADAPSIKGTETPIVSFKQYNRLVSVQVGIASSDWFVLSERVAELLYPSSVNTTLLAR